jgi:hypothetical protein
VSWAAEVPHHPDRRDVFITQTLNLILLTAGELSELRTTLKDCFKPEAKKDDREVGG